MTRKPSRQLERGHFAFMRAIAQGLDERASWDRYLQVEGDHADMRTVRRTIAWIRDAFAAAARREARPGTARLILLDPKRLPHAPERDRKASPGGISLGGAPPTLEAFAAASGMEDFSEVEQVAAYTAAYPNASTLSGDTAVHPRIAAQRLSRRARLIERQLDALRWLEELVAQEPKLGDSVGAWLNPALAQRLAHAGLPTLEALLQHVNGAGARWWLRVPGIGATKARRIVDWLHAHEGSLGAAPGAHTGIPRARVSNAILAAVVPAATALLPFEKFVTPPALSGRQGRGRAPLADCRMAAADDREALHAWIAAQRPHAGGAALSATQRAYRKEAERLLLWSVLERGQALSDLGPEDVTAYQAFLAAPPAAWCGPRHQQRWSPFWRPLEGGLSPSALRHANKVLRSLFAYWTRQRYVRSNPFAEATVSSPAPAPFSAGRVLSFFQWDRLDAALDRLPDDERNRRLCRAVRWLYLTGVRLSELTRIRCADIDHTDAGWVLKVRGEGAQHRVLPLPDMLVHEFEREMGRHGFEPCVQAVDNAPVALMARFAAAGMRPPVWSASGIYQAIKRLMGDVSEALDAIDPVQAAQLRRASTHWLRHSHGAHALQGRDGRAARPVDVVSRQLGHASRATTANYRHALTDPPGLPGDRRAG